MTDGNTNFQLSSYRYVCALLFVLAALINSFPTNTLVAASATAEQLYNQTKPIIVLCSLSNNLLIPFVLFPAVYLLDHVGLKTGLNVACAAMCTGSFLRLFINPSFAIYVFGTFITTIGSIIVMSAPIKFVKNWFAARRASLVSAIVVFALYSSDALGIFMSALFVADDSTHQQFLLLVGVQAVIAILVHLVMLCFFRERPSKPPR